MKCACTRLKVRVRKSNLVSDRPKRRLIAKCMDCPRSYVCSADPAEICMLLNPSAKS